MSIRRSLWFAFSLLMGSTAYTLLIYLGLEHPFPVYAAMLVFGILEEFAPAENRAERR